MFLTTSLRAANSSLLKESNAVTGGGVLISAADVAVVVVVAPLVPVLGIGLFISKHAMCQSHR
jgi:hypothetical protein